MMMKNSKVYLRVPTSLIDELKKEAIEREITLSEICRRRLEDISKWNQIEKVLLDLNRHLKYLTKYQTGG